MQGMAVIRTGVAITATITDVTRIGPGIITAAIVAGINIITRAITVPIMAAPASPSIWDLRAGRPWRFPSTDMGTPGDLMLRVGYAIGRCGVHSTVGCLTDVNH